MDILSEFTSRDCVGSWRKRNEYAKEESHTESSAGERGVSPVQEPVVNSEIGPGAPRQSETE